MRIQELEEEPVPPGPQPRFSGALCGDAQQESHDEDQEDEAIVWET